ncbi:HAMP domain-containing sensor histidine kinase [Kribbella sp. NPDC051770]|uniref:sensor histidine kinase n=1 Tax=Kribbella sp. NPDC051770 TaxID=3155413 RepID=UPI003447401C
MRGPAAERLRRLRWWLTVLFTVMNTIGLIVLAPLILRLDSNNTEADIRNQLDVVTGPVLRLVSESGGIDFTAVNRDPLNATCPQFVIVPGGAAPFDRHTSLKDCTPMDPTVLDQLATRAVSDGVVLSDDRKALGGEQVRVAVQPFRDSSGQYAGAVVAWTDIDDELGDHRQLVVTVLLVCAFLILAAALLGYWVSGRAIRPAMAALQEQENLLAETAHDLRTPVAALRALAETAMQDPHQRGELLPRTVRLAGRMGDIIDGLLVRARLAAGVEQLSMQLVWLDQLVGVVVEDTPSDSARISLVTAPTMVRADPALLQRAIGNLLDNALRHGRAPGADLAIVTVTVADGRITVADQGPGIDPAIGDDLFERGAAGSGSAGAGIGLSVVRWVALAHGGDLKVHNGDEGGAIFEFRLPVAER